MWTLYQIGKNGDDIMTDVTGFKCLTKIFKLARSDIISCQQMSSIWMSNPKIFATKTNSIRSRE